MLVDFQIRMWCVKWSTSKFSKFEAILWMFDKITSKGIKFDNITLNGIKSLPDDRVTKSLTTLHHGYVLYYYKSTSLYTCRHYTWLISNTTNEFDNEPEFSLGSWADPFICSLILHTLVYINLGKQEVLYLHDVFDVLVTKLWH